MWKMLQLDAPQDFVIATGETNLLQSFVAVAFECLGLDWRNHVDHDETLRRPTDIRVGRADPSLAARVLGWRATLKMDGVVRQMVKAENERMEGSPGSPPRSSTA